jgi:hypothetical protein
MRKKEMMTETQIRLDLKQIDEYLPHDRPLGKLSADFIGCINYQNYSKADIIRQVLLHVLNEKCLKGLE